MEDNSEFRYHPTHVYRVNKLLTKTTKKNERGTIFLTIGRLLDIHIHTKLTLIYTLKGTKKNELTKVQNCT